MHLLSPLLVAAAVSGLSVPLGAGEPQGPEPSDFAASVSAWQTRSASGVRRLIPEKERLSLDLEGTGDGRVVGRPTRENAEAILKEYFGKLDSATLKDVTPADSRSFTRTFDYTYRPTGAEARTTRLSLTLVALKEGGYGLIGAAERPRK